MDKFPIAFLTSSVVVGLAICGLYYFDIISTLNVVYTIAVTAILATVLEWMF